MYKEKAGSMPERNQATKKEQNQHIIKKKTTQNKTLCENGPFLLLIPAPQSSHVKEYEKTILCVCECVIFF